MAEKSKASNEPWSPSCLNDFWSLLGCEDEKLKQIRRERRLDLLQSLRRASSKQACDSPTEEDQRLRSFCCQRRRRKASPPKARPDAAATPWVWNPKPEEDELALEWKIVEHELDAESLRRLREFRQAVAAAGLDAHEACCKAPIAQRPGTLLRYLRARNWDSAAATKMLQDALDWRRDFRLDEKLDAWRAEWRDGSSGRARLWRKYGYIKYAGLDFEGLPVYLHRTSQCDANGLVREGGLETFILYHLVILEDSFNAAQERMMKTGKLITSFLEIYDQGDYGQVDGYLRRGMKAFEPYKAMIPILDKVYPERIRVAFVLRCPYVFASLWRVVESLLPPATVKKIRIKGYPAKTFVSEIKEYMLESNLPPHLRSDDRSLLAAAEPWGGWVPVGAGDE
ncbi:unnamed protein product [Effrenium voratum]|nr:unnamed protein product [Effrenium voratum]